MCVTCCVPSVIDSGRAVGDSVKPDRRRGSVGLAAGRCAYRVDEAGSAVSDAGGYTAAIGLASGALPPRAGGIAAAAGGVTAVHTHIVDERTELGWMVRSPSRIRVDHSVLQQGTTISPAHARQAVAHTRTTSTPAGSGAEPCSALIAT